MGWAPNLMWGFGSLAPTLLLAAVIAFTKDYAASGLILLVCVGVTVYGNLKLLGAFEATLNRRLVVESSNSKRPASDAKGLLALLMPAGDFFGAELGWVVMLILLLALTMGLQLVKPEPPGLLYLLIGYRLHDVSYEGGGAEVLVKHRRLNRGDTLLAVDPVERVWIGKVIE